MKEGIVHTNYATAFKEICTEHNKDSDDIASMLEMSTEEVEEVKVGKKRLNEQQAIKFAQELKISPFELTKRSLDNSPLLKS